jgi:peroxiredoxin
MNRDMRPYLLLLLASSTLALTACTRGSNGGSGDDDDDDALAADYGPANSWFHATEDEVPADLGSDGTGFNVGDVAPNWTLVDQHGDEVELYQFYGTAVLLDVFAEWCGPCQAHAPTGEEIWQEIEDRGVTIIGMMQENADGSPPNGPTDPARWADAYGLTHPVLADTAGNANTFATIGGGFPTYPLIGPDMTVMYADVYPPSMALLTQVLEDNGYW